MIRIYLAVALVLGFGLQATAGALDEIEAGAQFIPTKVDCTTLIPFLDNGTTFKGEVDGTLASSMGPQNLKLFITSLAPDPSLGSLPNWQNLCGKMNSLVGQKLTLKANAFGADLGQGQIQQWLVLLDANLSL